MWDFVMYMRFMTNVNDVFFIGRRDLSSMDSDIYIDYRGPETHPHIPSPNRSKGQHNGCKSKGIRASKPGLTQVRNSLPIGYYT